MHVRRATKIGYFLLSQSGTQLIGYGEDSGLGDKQTLQQAYS